MPTLAYSKNVSLKRFISHLVFSFRTAFFFQKFKNDYKVESNSDSTYLIVYYSPKNKLRSLNPPLKFFVYNTGDKKVIFQDNLANGKVKWKNKSQFIVTTIPEIIKGNEAGDIQNFGYTYDVISRRKLTGFDQNK